VLEQWERIVTFDERADWPSSGQDGLKSIMANAGNKAGGKSKL
jgi:multifunctional beta-oxidation protein